MHKIRYYYRGDNRSYILEFISRDNALNTYGHIMDDSRVAGCAFINPAGNIEFCFIE